MDKAPQDPSGVRPSLRAPLGAAGLVLDWATLAILGVATVALAVGARLASQDKRKRAAPTVEHPKT